MRGVAITKEKRHLGGFIPPEAHKGLGWMSIPGFRDKKALIYNLNFDLI